MNQHRSIPAGPRARSGSAVSAQPAVAPARHHAAPEALILFLLSWLLPPRAGEPDSRARLAPLLAVWALLPTRRLTRRTTDHPESVHAQAAATLRAIRRLVARAGWFIHGRRNRGMRPAAPPLVARHSIRPARPPPEPAAPSLAHPGHLTLGAGTPSRALNVTNSQHSYSSWNASARFRRTAGSTSNSSSSTASTRKVRLSGLVTNTVASPPDSSIARRR